jgi:hypothetical protein
MIWKKVLPPSFTLKMETVDSFRVLIITYQCTWHQIPEDGNFNINCLKNLKFHISVSVLGRMCALEGHPDAIFVLNKKYKENTEYKHHN